MSIHRGIVINNVDPARQGRLQVVVPSVNGDAVSWALPVISLGAPPLPAPTPLGTAVWVAFEADDVDHPVVLGLLPAVDTREPG